MEKKNKKWYFLTGGVLAGNLSSWNLDGSAAIMIDLYSIVADDEVCI